MTKPALLLDVDGVLSPFQDEDPAWDDFYEGPTRYALQLSKKMAAALAGLPCEIIWLTTWEHMANQYIAPEFGWENIRVLDTSEMNDREKRWWKHELAVRWYEKEQRPFAWIDDDHVAYPEAREWAEELPHMVHVICTSANVGITPEHIEELREFFEEAS